MFLNGYKVAYGKGSKYHPEKYCTFSIKTKDDEDAAAQLKYTSVFLCSSFYVRPEIWCRTRRESKDRRGRGGEDRERERRKERGGG